MKAWIVLAGSLFIFLGCTSTTEIASPAPTVASGESVGGVGGGGGKAVVCRNSSGNVLSVKLLDLWEGQVIYNETPAKLSGNLTNDVNTELVRLEYAPWPPDLFGCSINSDGVQDCASQTNIVRGLQMVTQRFLHPDPNVHWLGGVALTPTDDSFEIVQPTGNCHIEQLVNYQANGTVFVNQDLYDQMDATNKAALIAHESLYDMLRAMNLETNSIRTRRAIGYVSSGQSFKPTKVAAIPSPRTACLTSAPGAAIEVDIVPIINSGDLLENVTVFPIDLHGAYLLGVSSLGQAAYLAPGAMDTILSGTCSGGDGPIYGTGLNFDGPVEFDRQISMDWECTGGKVSGTLSITQPGTLDVVTIPINCITTSF